MTCLKAIAISIILLVPPTAHAQTSQVSLSVSPDHRQLLINSDIPVKQIQISGDALDPFIAQIGQIRSIIVPPMPQDPIKVTIVTPGRYHLGPNQDTGGLLMAIFHPGFGWIGFNISNDDAERLEQQLQKLHNHAQ
jgi:hypothetical protein